MLERNRLAEAFIRGIEMGAEYPDLAGDGDAMYDAFRNWINRYVTCLAGDFPHVCKGGPEGCLYDSETLSQGGIEPHWSWYVD